MKKGQIEYRDGQASTPVDQVASGRDDAGDAVDHPIQMGSQCPEQIVQLGDRNAMSAARLDTLQLYAKEDPVRVSREVTSLQVGRTTSLTMMRLRMNGQTWRK